MMIFHLVALGPNHQTVSHSDTGLAYGGKFADVCLYHEYQIAHDFTAAAHNKVELCDSAARSKIAGVSKKPGIATTKTAIATDEITNAVLVELRIGRGCRRL